MMGLDFDINSIRITCEKSRLFKFKAKIGIPSFDGMVDAAKLDA